MLDYIEGLKKEIKTYAIADKDDLEDFRLEFLSRNGKVPEMFSRMNEVPNEQKAKVGKAMNESKNLAQDKFDSYKEKLEQKKYVSLKAKDDLSFSAPTLSTGSLHLLNTIHEVVTHT